MRVLAVDPWQNCAYLATFAQKRAIFLFFDIIFFVFACIYQNNILLLQRK